MVHSDSRISRVAARKSGKRPASNSAWRAARASRIRGGVARKSRASDATNARARA
jgi:hypothetical protein